MQVKNLRSQVGRAAVHVMAELFVHLKRSMESDLEKIALPLVLKTGETNRFLREDCNLCLDRWVPSIWGIFRLKCLFIAFNCLMP